MPSILVNTDNKTPTPTTIDLLPLARVELGMAPGIQSDTDTKLVYLAQVAMAKYAELYPRIERTTFTTKEGTLAYPLPDDCVKVLDVNNPSQYGYYNDWLFLPMIDTPSSSIFGYSDYAFRSPSERVIRQEILTELDHYAQSYATWYVDGVPLQLYILPQSVASGLSITVRYAAQYQNVGADTLNPSWTGLQAGHWQHIIKLMKWALADGRADQVLSPQTLTSEQGGGRLAEAWNLSNRADRLLAEVANTLGVNRSVAVRG